MTDVDQYVTNQGSGSYLDMKSMLEVANRHPEVARVIHDRCVSPVYLQFGTKVVTALDDIRSDLGICRLITDRSINIQTVYAVRHVGQFEYELFCQVVSNKETIQALMDQNAASQAQIQLLAQHCAQLASRYEHLEEIVHLMPDQMDDLVTEKLNDQLVQRDIDLTQHPGQVEELDEAVQKLSIMLSDQADQYDTEIQQLFDQLDAQAVQHGAEIQQLSDQLATQAVQHGAEIQQLSDQLATQAVQHGAEIQQLSDQLATQADQYGTEIQQLSDQLATQADQYGTEIQQLSDQLATQIAQHGVEVARLSDQLDTQITQHGVEVARLSDQLDTQAVQISAALKQSIDLTTQAVQHGAEVAQLSNQLDTHSAISCNLVEQADRMNSTICDLVGQIDSLNAIYAT